MIGKTISHYRILEKLGEGGMGVVYKARDLKLDRYAALKFLPPHMHLDGEAKARFIHEAKAASAIDSPHIATIYEIDETPEKQLYIAMAYYEGVTLRAMIERGRPSFDTAIDIGAQIARGLADAHKRGIIHRDIKPANIMITPENTAKIVDFGLAKLSGATKITRTGETTGTASYMSPEQAKGEEVDQRSDIFSLGIVIYEMLTGAAPFKGEYTPAILHSIIHDEPEPLATHESSIPEGMQRIVDRALAKDPVLRYANADDLCKDLLNLKKDISSCRGNSSARHRRRRRALLSAVVIAAFAVFIGLTIHGGFFKGPAGTHTTERSVWKSVVDGLIRRSSEETFSILVTPFWGNSEAALEDGRVMQELLFRKLGETLGEEKDVRILTAEEARMPRSHMEARDLGRQLNASMVIWGEVLVLKEETEIQPHISMVRPIEDSKDKEQSPKPLKPEPADPNQLKLRKKKAGEVGEMIIHVAARYYLTKDPAKALALVQRLPDTDSKRFSLQAHILSVLGRSNEALEAYKKAASLAPQDPFTRINLGLQLLLLQSYDAALAEFQKAIDLDRNNARGYADLAYFYEQAGRRELGITELEKAVSLNPRDVEVIQRIAIMYNALGQPELAIAQYQRALSITPHSPELLCGLAEAYKSLGKYEDAYLELKKASAIIPNDVRLLCRLGSAYGRLKRYERAAAELNKAISLAPNDPEPYYFLGSTYLDQKLYKKAIKPLQRSAKLDPANFSTCILLGNAYGRIGKRTKAVEMFNKAVNLGYETFGETVRMFIANNYRDLEWYAESVGELKEAIRLTPDSTYTNDFHHSLGWTYEAMGNYVQALSEYRRAVELDLCNNWFASSPQCYLVLCRLGRQREANTFLLEQIQEMKDQKWCPFRNYFGPLLDFYAGEISEEDLLKAVPLSIGHYYIGMSYLINVKAAPSASSVDTARALEHFEQCLRLREDDWETADRVKRELRRLGKEIPD